MHPRSKWMFTCFNMLNLPNVLIASFKGFGCFSASSDRVLCAVFGPGVLPMSHKHCRGMFPVEMRIRSATCQMASELLRGPACETPLRSGKVSHCHIAPGATDKAVSFGLQWLLGADILLLTILQSIDDVRSTPRFSDFISAQFDPCCRCRRASNAETKGKLQRPMK
jgi:hypothetical protein